MIVEAALASFLSPDAGDRREAASPGGSIASRASSKRCDRNYPDRDWRSSCAISCRHPAGAGGPSEAARAQAKGSEHFTALDRNLQPQQLW